MIEDAAQAHGALEHGRSAAVAYSFYPTKNLGGIGDGGAVVTDDAALAAEIRLLRHHGMRDLYVHERVATNFRMSELEAAVLRIGLRHLPAWNARRRAIAQRYRSAAPAARLARRPPAPRAPPVRAAQRRARGAGARGCPRVTGIHYPLARDAAAGLPRVRARRVPARRSVGRGVRHPALLSRATRRRGATCCARRCA